MRLWTKFQRDFLFFVGHFTNHCHLFHHVTSRQIGKINHKPLYWFVSNYSLHCDGRAGWSWSSVACQCWFCCALPWTSLRRYHQYYQWPANPPHSNWLCLVSSHLPRGVNRELCPSMTDAVWGSHCGLSQNPRDERACLWSVCQMVSRPWPPLSEVMLSGSLVAALDSYETLLIILWRVPTFQSHLVSTWSISGTQIRCCVTRMRPGR